MKTGYSIRTWRMRLFCPEPLWLDRTEEYFQSVVEFYYDLLKSREELWNNSLFDIQRSLELPTVAGRDGRQPTNPLPMGKVPVYLRRAAINKASAAVKSSLTQEESGFPGKIEAKVTFFKGMLPAIMFAASIGIAGVPGAGMIMLAMVLTSVGLPVDGIALVAGVDRIFDMGRTTVNITGDAACNMVVSNLAAKRETKKS